jgi:hypothetical protein
MLNLPLEERMTPENEAKWRNKIKTQIGLSKDISASFGGKPADYLKSFTRANKPKIRALQIGVAKRLQDKFSNIKQLPRKQIANVPQFRKAA